MAEKPLTDTMRLALGLAMAYGGELRRHPGGNWGGPTAADARGSHIGTPTIPALVDRGLAEFTEWRRGTITRIPVRLKLLDAGRTIAEEA